MNPIPLLFAAGGLVVSAVMAWGAVGHLRRARVIADTKTSPCADVRGGLVEVKGAVSPLSAPLTSPMTGTECVYFRFHVEERVKSGKNSKWVTRVDDKQYARVLVEDATGAVELDLSGADLVLAVDHRESSGTFDDPSPELEALLSRYGQSSSGWLLNKRMRYAEAVLQVGDDVYALGTASGGGEGFPVLARGADGLLVVSDSDEQALVMRYRGQAIIFGFGALIGVGVSAVLASLAFG